MFVSEPGAALIAEILSIRIDIGEFSGALPQVFTSYFPMIAEDYPLLRSARLDLRTVPGEVLCANCSSLYNVIRQKGICPQCKSREKTILGGKDIQLMSIGY